MFRLLPVLPILLVASAQLSAEVSLSNLFSDHMVLQRRLADPIWGKAAPGESVTVSIAGQSHTATADADGHWRVVLDPMEAGGPYEMTISGSNTVTISDILVGEVWVCSGQSNMEWPVGKVYNAEVELATATNDQIRLLSVSNPHSQERQDNFEGSWQVCSPDTVADFSAVGYFYGRRLQQALGVPIGLIDNARGGTVIESWMPRDLLEANEANADYLASWNARLDGYTDEVHAQKIAEWEAATAAWKEQGSQGKRPGRPSDPRSHRRCPSVCYNAALSPIIGYGIQGMIWYQGETNTWASQGPYEENFPAFIEEVRAEWGQGDFPFYWVQLADHLPEKEDPNAPSAWAALREGQTLTQDKVPNTGQAVIIDVGEGRDIHPRNKQVPADRLVRWPLARVYGFSIAPESPRFESMKIEGNQAILSFRDTHDGLFSYDVEAPVGFAIAGEDQVFVWAEAKIVGKNRVAVWSDQVEQPVAVRYGWADNPKANLYDKSGLPVTPFRTDDWPTKK